MTKAGSRRGRAPASPRAAALSLASAAALGRGRVALGFAIALLCGPLLTWLLYSVRHPASITTEAPLFQVLVVVVALVGGLWPALFAAVLSALTLDYLFVAPQFSVTVADPLHLWALSLYAVVAVLVSWIVDQAARRGRTAQRARVLAETDQVRSALLSAVSHDLRRPLAAAVASVGGLRAAAAQLSQADRDELLETADESLATLSSLVIDLLDVSRVQAGVLAVSLRPVDTSDSVVSALDELHAGPDTVEPALDPDLPLVEADPVLLQRVLVNVLSNAVRHSPTGSRVRIATSRLGSTVQIRVVDRGPGIAADRRGEMFAPFQRLGDTDNTTGLGLGLALSKGFTEGMGGTLTPEDTPGGGLTMVIALPVARLAPDREEAP